jgi:8-oxo-dGTP diphosphatase
MEEFPRVGVGVIIKNNSKVLLGKRKNSHGAGTWSFPGGKLDFFETIEHCAIRETLEETGLNIKVIPYYKKNCTEDFFDNEKKHYLTVYVEANYLSGIPKVLEPDKCEEWEWYNWSNLPQPLFLPIQNLIKQRYSPF